MSYFDTLFSASYNGVPFVVRKADGEFGRRVVVHKYAFRNTPWPEDVGKKAREFEIDGFIEGDDVTAQLQFLLSVVELNGSGVLIHPSLGILNVTLLNLRTEESYEHGRVVMLHFKFIEAGKRIYPSVALVGNASSSGNLSFASIGNFVSNASNALQAGAQVALQATIAAQTLAAIAQAGIKTATNIASAASSVTGSSGRNPNATTGIG